jgi:hypothetical protein
MSPSSTITLAIPRAESETVFLRRVVEAALHAYRADQNWKGKDEDPPQSFKSRLTPWGENARPADRMAS